MHVQAAKVCLKILNDPDHWNKEVEELPLDRRDLLRYASKNWQRHLQQCDDSDVGDRLVRLLKQFLGSMNESGPAYRSLYEKNFFSNTYWFRFLKPFSRSCHAIVAFSLDRFLPAWWASGFDDINERNSDGETLLMTAAENGQLSTVGALIEKGGRCQH